MEEKKNQKGLICLIVILIILVLGLVGYIVYDKVLLEDKTSVNNDNTTSTTTQKTEEQIKLTDEEIETYLNYVPLASISKDAYSENIVNINTIDKKSLLFSLFHNDKVMNYTSECVSEKDFNENLEKIYNIKIDNFSGEVKGTEEWFESYLILKDSNYCELGHGSLKEKSDTNVVSYKINSNELIIREQIGFINFGDENVTVWDGNELVKTFEETNDVENSNYKQQAEEFVKNNINSFNTYKHTFKQNTGGTYYWYSTELVNN